VQISGENQSAFKFVLESDQVTFTALPSRADS
jgi:hypothetical protein